MDFKITVLAGDGVGPEVTREALKVLEKAGEKFGFKFQITTRPVGGAALDQTGRPLPPETLQSCLDSDAVLLGAVGGPRWDDNPPELKPERALLLLRKEMGLYANLRPARLYPQLADASPLKNEVIRDVDILIVRELTGGIYFGEPRGIDGEELAYNTEIYSAREVERIARVAFDAARKRRRKVTSVDKANILESSQLWRRIVTRVGAEYPDVRLEHIYVDNCAMQLITNPRRFDVILTNNIFGDILSDELAVIPGSIGMLPSASLGERHALYEPVHGSAPDIAGRSLANPLAAILSVAMMLRYSFHLDEAADAVERAVTSVLEAGLRTADIARGTERVVSTQEMGSAVAERV